ncbi:PHD finger protein 7-like [Tympanuchus pallidicinctus]|uniref:PHD finger protein 7-like n=1 Tax=Tympanuchus pallidicinctus TaxID=109042 RepID=UPI002286E6FB|nr:PHD finger protein 7-like [Tympanuchus pallidicinctus]XP_052536754.1 PHD finger protein 7-like [Tympanuchus pallidicinctus]
MSDRKRKASGSEEPVCILCGRADVDTDICGNMLSESGIHVHEFCLDFAIISSDARPTQSGTLGLPVDAIRRAVKQATKQQCFVCGERGASITCVVTSCRRSFHLPCAMDGECVTHFFGYHWTFCSEHRPRQETYPAPSEGTHCLICLEPVGDSLSYHTLVCPTCQHAWFHRGCIQQQASIAGSLCFQCAACRDSILFFAEMAILGIRIPYRIPAWEDNNAYEALLQRHSHCDASECLYHGGREQAESSGPWQLLLCSSCAAEGTHRQCSHLNDTTATWECDSCAGLRTASSANTELAGPCTASERAPGPSPAAARRRRPRQRGRSRTRSRSPLRGRAPSSRSRPRRRRGSRQTPAPGQRRGTRSRSATSRSPRASRVPGRRGPSRQRRRTRTRSPPPQRRRAQNSRGSRQGGSRRRAQRRRTSRE